MPGQKCLKSHFKGVIDWTIPKKEYLSPEDGILLGNRSRTSVFWLPNCLDLLCIHVKMLQWRSRWHYNVKPTEDESGWNNRPVSSSLMMLKSEFRPVTQKMSEHLAGPHHVHHGRHLTSVYCFSLPCGQMEEQKCSSRKRSSETIGRYRSTGIRSGESITYAGPCFIQSETCTAVT